MPCERQSTLPVHCRYVLICFYMYTVHKAIYKLVTCRALSFTFSYEHVHFTKHAINVVSGVERILSLRALWSLCSSRA